MARLCNAFFLTNVLDFLSDDKFDFAFVRPGFAMFLWIIWLIPYLAQQRLVVVSMCAAGGRHRRVSSSALMRVGMSLLKLARGVIMRGWIRLRIYCGNVPPFRSLKLILSTRKSKVWVGCQLSSRLYKIVLVRWGAMQCNWVSRLDFYVRTKNRVPSCFCRALFLVGYYCSTRSTRR